MSFSKLSQPKPLPVAQSSSDRAALLRVIVPYAVFSALWILLSDRVLAWWVSDPAQLTTLQTYKGWFFVAVSTFIIALLLAGVLRRQRRLFDSLAESERRVHKLNRAYVVLSEINQTIVRERSPDAFLTRACAIAVELGGFRMAWVGLVDPATTAVVPVAHAGVIDGYLDRLNIRLDDPTTGRGPTGSALHTRQHVVVDSVKDDARMAPWRELALHLGYQSIAAFPLISGGKVRGVITLYASEPAFFDADELMIFDEMALDLAFALEMAEQERQHRESERLRQEAEERLQMAITVGNVGLWDWDLHTNKVHFSPEWKRQIGYDADEIPDALEEWERRVHPDDLPCTLATIQAFIADPWPDYHLEFRFRHKDGSYRWILAQAALLTDADGQAYRMLGTHIDITSQKEAEAERQQLLQQHAAELEAQVKQRTAELQAAMEKAQTADRLKSTFLATMSHELRTPLNSIIGFTSVLNQELAGPLNDEQKKQLGMVQNSARHLLALINDVLDISKIEAGQIEIIRSPFDIHEAIETVMRSVLPMAQKKGLELTVSFGPAVGAVVSDRRRVGQILLNLLSNAVKFTERGQVELQAWLDAGQLYVSVRDTGIGIKAEDLRHLFRPFQQLDGGLARRHEGTGLGLSICANLARLLGGEVTVESAWGVGSTFTLRLPLQPIEHLNADERGAR